MKFYTLAIFAALIGCNGYGMESQKSVEKPIIFTDAKHIVHDIHNKYLTGAKFALCAPWILRKNPRMLIHLPIILKKGYRVAQETNGTANIIDKVAQELEQEGYGSLTQDQLKAILALSVDPIARHKEIAYFKSLKDQGYNVVIATNMDSEHFKVYQSKMPALEKAFSYYVTAPYKNEGESLQNDYAVAPAPFPNNEYVGTLKKVADRFGAKEIILLKGLQSEIGPMSAKLQQELSIKPVVFTSIEALDSILKQ